jgi:rubrerythrin
MTDDAKFSITDIHILDICCKIEETCADLYRYFSKTYADSPQISALWEKTAKEEDSHAEHFRLAYRLQGRGIRSLKTDMNQANKTLTMVQGIYESVLKSPQTLKDALWFAIQLELLISEYHMNTLAAFDDKNLERLFSSMMNNDKDHISMLEKSYKELFE